jgi:hypothetical protein
MTRAQNGFEQIRRRYDTLDPSAAIIDDRHWYTGLSQLLDQIED